MALRWYTEIEEPHYAATEEEALVVLKRCLDKVEDDPSDPLGFDVETFAKKLPFKVGGRTPLDWFYDTITFWSLAFREGDEIERWCLRGQDFHLFIPLFENKKATFAIWNAKFDAHIAWNCLVDIWHATVYDVLVMAHLYDENYKNKMGLKLCAPRWIGLHMTKFKDLFKGVKNKKGKPLKEYEIPLTELADKHPGKLIDIIDYASTDAYAHLKLFYFLRDELMRIPLTPVYSMGRDGEFRLDRECLEDGTMWDTFLDVDVPCCQTLWRMERRGMVADGDYLNSLKPKITKELNKTLRDINHKVGWPVNISSTKQLRQLFFGPKDDIDQPGMGLKPIKKTKGGLASTDEEVLNKLAEIHNIDIADKILRCRSLIKTKGTYVDALTNMLEHFHDKRIHPSFNQYGARTGRFSSVGPNCFDEETEILTMRGWIQFKYLGWGDLVAQWNEDGSVEFVVPIEIIRQRYEGWMVHVSNQHIDLMMTPNHRCPLRNRKRMNLQVHSASEYPSDKHQIHGGVYRCPSRLITDIDPWLMRFFLAVQADGSWQSGMAVKDCKTYRPVSLDFGFNKKRKANRLKKILDNLEMPYVLKEDTKKKHNKYRFYVRNHPHVNSAWELLGIEKKLGSWVLDLDRKAMDDFCNEIFFWDGYWKGKTMYASSIEENADWVQAVLTLSGRRAKIREYHGSKKISYQVDHTDRDYSLTTNVRKVKKKYRGDVYCTTVHSGFIIVRRNGKVCVSGNSQNFPRPDTDEFKIRRAFIAPPGKKLIAADYSQLEMLIMAHMSKDKEMLKAIGNGDDLHCRTVALMYPGIPYEEVFAAKKSKGPNSKQKELLGLRQDAKRTGYGILYGIGPPGLAKQLGVSFEEAKDKIDLYLRKAYTGVDSYIKDVHTTCGTARETNVKYDQHRQLYFVRTLLGRRRRLLDIVHQNRNLRGHAERESVNAIIQGTAADIVKCAMLRVEFSKRLNNLGVMLLNQIHDELVMEVPEENVEEAMPIIKRYMEHPFGDSVEALDVPIPVDIKSVDDWSQAK